MPKNLTMKFPDDWEEVIVQGLDENHKPKRESVIAPARFGEEARR